MAAIGKKGDLGFEVALPGRVRDLEELVVSYASQTRVDGIQSASLSLSLARNAVIQTFDVVVTARRAGAAPVHSVAQIRASGPVSASANPRLVLDFGTMRTVSGLQVPAGMRVESVSAWLGMQFDAEPFYAAPPRAEFEALDDIDLALFDAEIRSERLLVELAADVDVDLDALAEDMAVVLPEPPSDLELRIDNGAPAWVHPGPAQEGTAATLTDDAWNTDGERIVHLGPALAALTGDPTRAETATFELSLQSRIPGVLAVREHARSVRFIERVAFAGQAGKTLSFTGEGRIELPLALAAKPGQSPRIEQAHVTLAAELLPERALPPVGPGFAPLPGATDAPLAELLLDAQRAFCVRLDHDARLAELTAVRLPLRAAGDGAEARVVLWANKDASSVQPQEPLETGTSAAVILEPGADGWITFPFGRPVAVDPANPPWAALLVARGTISWSLAAPAPGDLAVGELRCGPPNGPWKRLPAPFQAAGSPLRGLRGRVRVVGHAPGNAPVAPLILSLAQAPQATIEVTPSARDATVLLPATALAAGVEQATLVVTSRVPGDITLRSVDVLWSLPGGPNA
jgi:hypothetical protein